MGLVGFQMFQSSRSSVALILYAVHFNEANPSLLKVYSFQYGVMILGVAEHDRISNSYSTILYLYVSPQPLSQATVVDLLTRNRQPQRESVGRRS